MRRTVNIVVSVLITLALALLGVFVFSSSYLRFGESCKEFGLSAAYYFCEIFGISHTVTPSGNTPSQVVTNGIKLPAEWNGFTEKAGEYFALLFSGENFVGWWGTVTQTLSTLSKALVLLLPCVVGIWFVVKWLYGRSNTKHNKDTVPLVVFKFVSKYTYQPLKRFVRGYACFLQ